MQRFRDLVIGVDGGGTTTRFAVADAESGQVIRQATSGSISPYVYPWDYVLTNIKMGLTALFNDATGLNPAHVRAAAFGVSGVDRPEHEVNFSKKVLPLMPQAIVKVVNDGVIALLGGLKGESGLLAISGTGSIAYGINPEGKDLRVGGWGHVLGDEGSGYRLGLEALRRIMRAYDQVSRPTLLTGLILKHLGLITPPDLLDWTNRIKADKGQIAALSVCVHEAAAAGDQAALQILEVEARGLARQVETIHRRLFDSHRSGPVEVVCAGGNLVNGRDYYRIFGQIISSLLPQAEVKHPEHQPVIGAVRLALKCL
ncbi:MAG: BadF/BadG/BcrA/BcrD ATPase family protein [Candidatus Sumerlaeia bacterium]